MKKGETDPIWLERLGQEPRSRKAAIVRQILLGMEESQWLAPDDLEKQQFGHMATLLAHAKATIPYYALTLDRVGTGSADHLRDGRWLELPVLSRDVVNRLGDDLLSSDIPPSHGKLNAIYTSGTTGKPVRVVRTQRTLLFWSALTNRDHIWHNRDVTGVLAAIRSSAKDFALYPGGVNHPAWGSRDGVFETGKAVSLNVNTSMADMADWIDRRKPDYLLTMPNIIRRLAPYCIDNGITFPFLKEIHGIGEMCGELIRNQCREAWNVHLHDMYSSREVGYMALQCPVNDHYHVQSETVFLEVLDDNDEPCSPGETGRVVVTTLENYAMPLIRYEVGDYAVVGHTCDCGRGLPVIERILGRQQEILVLPTGEQRWTLLGSPDVRHFMEMAPITQYQFAHVAAEKIEVRLATKRVLTPDEEENISEWTRKKFGYPFQIDFLYFDSLPLSAAGKFKDFVVEFQPDS